MTTDNDLDNLTVAQPEPNTIRVANEALRHGFTIIPNYVLRSPDLSRDAKLLYGILLSYAWQKGSCFPGYETLQKDMGCGSAQIARYIKELKDSGWLHVVRRGQGKTNIYTLQDPVKNGDDSLFFQNERTGSSVLKEPVLSKTKEEEYSWNNTQKKNTKNSNIRNTSCSQEKNVDNSPVSSDQEEQQQPTSGGVERVGEVLARHELTSTPAESAAYAEARQVIVDYLEDFGREFNDQASLKSSASRACNIFKKAGVSLEAFIQAMYEARARTKEMTHAIRSKSEEEGRAFPTKRKMAYFFACLEERLGLRAPPEPGKAGERQGQSGAGKERADTAKYFKGKYGRLVRH